MANGCFLKILDSFGYALENFHSFMKALRAEASVEAPSQITWLLFR